MKNNNVALKTMAMKAKVANFLRKSFYKTKIKPEGGYGKTLITDEEKLKLFDVIWAMSQEMHRELNAYKWKRQHKAAIQKAREERKNKKQ